MSHHSDDGSVNNGEIETAVLSYLRSHPDAADTIEGIVAWWLPLQRYEIGKARVEAALTRLVDAGVLHRDRLPHGEKLYSLVTDASRTSREQ